MPEETLKSALKKVQAGEIKPKEFRLIALEHGMTATFWDAKTESHPAAQGNNLSRIGFEFDAYHHPKGQFFQNVIKKIFLTAIGTGHSLWRQKYSKDCFKYDDARLNQLDIYLKEHIKNTVSEGIGYKDPFMNQLVDLTLGMMKEDIYYRAVIFDFINTFCGRAIFELEECEKEVLRKYTKRPVPDNGGKP